MHLEIPKLSAHSFKDFAKHYLMIVLSILTALGLEQWLERSHHTHAAEAAGRTIRAELEANLTDVRTSVRANRGFGEPLQQLETVVAKDLADKLPAKLINEHIRERQKAFTLSLNWPTFAFEAWDVAVANQSVSWMDNRELRRYSGAYADLRDASSWLTHDSVILLNTQAMGALDTRIKLGLDVDPVEFLTVLHQMANTSKEVQSHLQQLDTHMTKALTASDRDDRG